MIQGYLIVYMDESGFDHETIRPYGYAPRGKPCIDRYNWQDKKRTNIIGTCTREYYLSLITLIRLSMATYSTTGARSH